MLNLYSSLGVRDHISYPYKTMGKITERLQEDKIDSEKNDSRHLSVLICCEFHLENHFDLSLSFPATSTLPQYQKIFFDS
jgi:hypothetical protein